MRPLDPKNFRLPWAIQSLDEDPEIQTRATIRPGERVTRSFPFFPPSSNLKSVPAILNPEMAMKEEVQGIPTIENVFSIETNNDQARLSLSLQSASEKNYNEGEGNTTNTCEVCGKRFTLKTNLTAHKKLHVRGATTCKWCSKTLSTIGNLR